ncbi:glycosyltransferase family 4 protein [Vibrio parahaemolyticus]|uniref:glycosyltransferase family 4 protein n=1 Tax=Vibrio parahaemolyticus TaxID=670 RepID=UPI002012CD97|nr:glycosyltransferase family 4 protein [Vibrio parahaemolyticus]
MISSKVNKTPMVFEVRDLWPEIPIAVGAIKNPILIWLSKKLEKFAYNNANRLVGLSPGMCEGIEKAGIHKEKITLATNSCDTGLFDVDRNVGIKYIKESLAFLNNRKLVVYTGTFGPINDVNYIVKLAEASMNRFPNICFVAVGSGMMKEGVIDLAKSRGVLNKNLYILDPMPKTEVVKLLSAAELSLSLFGDVKEMWHNSANKLFDALASQTPIAINYGGWQKDLIDNYQCGVVLHKLDYEGAAYAINDFLSDSNRYKKAKFSCKDLAYNHYSRDIMADRLEKALLEAIND